MNDIRETLKQRGSVYGNFSTLAYTSQSMKLVCRMNPGWFSLSKTERESIEMVLHKIARIVNGGGGSKMKDEIRDCIGYLTLIADNYKDAKEWKE